jgi:hypothetical protein
MRAMTSHAEACGPVGSTCPDPVDGSRLISLQRSGCRRKPSGVWCRRDQPGADRPVAAPGEPVQRCPAVSNIRGKPSVYKP